MLQGAAGVCAIASRCFYHFISGCVICVTCAMCCFFLVSCLFHIAMEAVNVGTWQTSPEGTIKAYRICICVPLLLSNTPTADAATIMPHSGGWCWAGDECRPVSSRHDAQDRGQVVQVSPSPHRVSGAQPDWPSDLGPRSLSLAPGCSTPHVENYRGQSSLKRQIFFSCIPP